jgi:hypothetical protein
MAKSNGLASASSLTEFAPAPKSKELKMVDKIPDAVRKEAYLTRKNGVPGGNKILFNTKQGAELLDWYMSAPEEAFHAPPRKFEDSTPLLASVRAKLLKSSALAPGDGQASGNVPWIFGITAPVVDHQNDLVMEGAAEYDPKNFPVLLAHNSEALPIARSSVPWVVNGLTLAIANFPAPGISTVSDQVAAMVRAGQVKGASIGFIPLKYSLSKDPTRPFGINFEKIRVCEWRICSIPCCPAALAIGPAGNKSASASMAGPTSTREERIAEAAKFRRTAYSI